MGTLKGWSLWPEKAVFTGPTVSRTMSQETYKWRPSAVLQGVDRGFHDLLECWDLFVLHLNTIQKTALFLLTTRTQIQYLQSSYSVSQYNVPSTNLYNVVIIAHLRRNLNDQPVGTEHMEQNTLSLPLNKAFVTGDY